MGLRIKYAQCDEAAGMKQLDITFTLGTGEGLGKVQRQTEDPTDKGDI